MGIRTRATWKSFNPRNYFNKSDKIDLYETRTNVIKSLFVFFQNKLAKAQEYLENIKEADHHSLPFLLSKGCLCFYRKDFRMAHRHFLLAFRLYGRNFSLLKYILGLCNFQLEDYVMSERCFLSYLESKPQKPVFCLGTLAVLYLKTRQYNKYNQVISDAFHSCHKQRIFEVNVMVALAEHFLYNGHFSNAQRVARMILKVNFEGRRRLREQGPLTEESAPPIKAQPILSEELRSQLLFIIGKCRHEEMTRDALQDAHRLFLSAVKIWKRSLTRQLPRPVRTRPNVHFSQKLRESRRVSPVPFAETA